MSNIIDVDESISNRRLKLASQLLQSFEGFDAKPCYDIAGKLTIGYGHQIIDSFDKDLGIKYLELSQQQINSGLSHDLATKLLVYDLMFRANINKLIVDIKQDNIWLALTSFCFNIGYSHFKQSDALKFIQINDFYKTADSMSSWRDNKHEFCEGIAKRRLCEVLILLNQSLDINSSVSPSQQINSSYTMTFLDDDWKHLSIAHKKEVLDLYKTFSQKMI